MNEVWLNFSQPMNFADSYKDMFAISVTGPYSNYTYNITATSINPTTYFMNFTFVWAFGRKWENITFTVSELL